MQPILCWQKERTQLKWNVEVSSLDWRIYLKSTGIQYACMPLGYSTFLSTDPKARLSTKDAHIHHSMFHVWNEIKKSIVVLLINHRKLCWWSYRFTEADSQSKLKHTSEESGITPRVAFGRGHLVLYVAKDCFGDFIKSLGTILQEKRHAIGIHKCSSATLLESCILLKVRKKTLIV